MDRGVSFPFRFGTRGRVVMSDSYDYTNTHIVESIKQIILTNKGERPMEPEFGSDVRRLVFEQNQPSLDNIAIDFAYRALKRWEPRISIDKKDINIVRDKNKIYLVVNTGSMDIIKIEVGGDFNE